MIAKAIWCCHAKRSDVKLTLVIKIKISSTSKCICYKATKLEWYHAIIKCDQFRIKLDDVGLWYSDDFRKNKS